MKHYNSNLIESLEKVKKKNDFHEFSSVFIQRIPRYGIKFPGGRWTTKNKPLSDLPILAHLTGKYYVGVIGQWYPQFIILDIDHKSIEIADEIRSKLNLNDSDSMLYTSESQNSYHLLIPRPKLNGKPATIRCINDFFKAFAHANNIEIYPQANKVIRLPFSPHQKQLDLAYYDLSDWPQKLFWFQKLDSFDLATIPSAQLEFDFSLSAKNDDVISSMQEGKELLEHGLQTSSSRNDSQFRVLYYYWRNDIPQSQAEALTWNWITHKHNGFSKDIVIYPQIVRNEISRQASRVFEHYEMRGTYPDLIDKKFYGYVAEPDVFKIMRECRGSFPRMKFLFHIVKYCYPRKHRNQVHIHRDKFVKWSSNRTYLSYLYELESQGLLTRGKSYYQDQFSKGLKLNWRYLTSTEAILFDGRSVNSFEGTLRLIFEPRELVAMLRSVGVSRPLSYMSAKRIFKD